MHFEHMRFGVFLPPYHPCDENPALAIRRDLDLVQWADQLGFNEAWMGEHHSGGVEIVSSPELFIAAAIERTRRIRLGTGVVSLPYHNPLMVADRLVQLDHMSMGRVMMGAGPGLLPLDARMLGIDPDTTRDRLVEALEVVLALLRGETVTRKTEWFNLVEARLHLLPYSGQIEAVVASARTPSGGRIAGTFGLGMMCMTASQSDGFDALSTNWELANEVAAKNGKSMDRSSLRLVAPIHIAETREKAYANVRFGVAKWLDYQWASYPAARAKQEGLDPVDVVVNHRGALIGTPDDAISLIEKLREKQGDFGCFLIVGNNWADFEETKKSYELFARYVIPHFKKMNESRWASLNLFKNQADSIADAHASSAGKMFDRYNKERAEQGRDTVAVPTKFAL